MFSFNLEDATNQEETEEYDRLNYQTIPDHVWKIFPAHGEYVVNALQFCDYRNREAIVKLKDKTEANKMFKWLADHHELVPSDEKKQIFGIFASKPHLVAILPGLESSFKRFVKTVEDLVPKKGSKSQEKLSRTSCESKKKPEANIKSKQKPDVEYLNKLLLKWITKEAQTKHVKVTLDEILGPFSITESENGNFIFKCKRLICGDSCNLPYSSKNNTVTLSNAYRHLKQSCWLSTTNKVSKASSQKTLKQSFQLPTCSKSNETDRVFIPHHPDDVDMNINSRALIDVDSATTNEANSLSLSMPETQDDFNLGLAMETITSSITTPKNLLPPAGLVALIDDSGR